MNIAPNKGFQATSPLRGAAPEPRRWAAAMKIFLSSCVFLISGCASAPQPFCIPPNLTRAPESPGLPRAPSNADDEYARCKEREKEWNDEAQLDAKLREDEVLAKKNEAEKLEQELREMQEQEQEQQQEHEKTK